MTSRLALSIDIARAVAAECRIHRPASLLLARMALLVDKELQTAGLPWDIPAPKARPVALLPSPRVKAFHP